MTITTLLEQRNHNQTDDIIQKSEGKSLFLWGRMKTPTTFTKPSHLLIPKPYFSTSITFADLKRSEIQEVPKVHDQKNIQFISFHKQINVNNR